MRALQASAAFAVALLASGVVKADLGGADITGPSGQTTTGQSYKARCGLDKKECVVSFDNEKLIVDGTGGIYRDQYINVILKRECKQRSLLLPWVTSCFENQYDWDFTITYRSNEGTAKTALISFMPRYLSTGATDRAREFERDLQIWAQTVLRPIGPSIEVRPGPEPIAPIQTRPVPESLQRDFTQ